MTLQPESEAEYAAFDQIDDRSWDTGLIGVSGADAIEELRRRVEALEALLREERTP